MTPSKIFSGSSPISTPARCGNAQSSSSITTPSRVLRAGVDLEQAQLDRAVAEQRPAGEAEEQAVADLAGGAGDGDLEGCGAHDDSLCGEGCSSADASSAPARPVDRAGLLAPCPMPCAMTVPRGRARARRAAVVALRAGRLRVRGARDRAALRGRRAGHPDADARPRRLRRRASTTRGSRSSPGASGPTRRPTARAAPTVDGDRPSPAEVAGVEATVVETAPATAGGVEGESAEWFAQDRDGNVWHLGDPTGVWEAGESTAPRPASPCPRRPGWATASGRSRRPGSRRTPRRVLSLDEQRTTPYDAFDALVQVEDSSPLRPGVDQRGVLRPRDRAGARGGGRRGPRAGGLHQRVSLSRDGAPGCGRPRRRRAAAAPTAGAGLRRLPGCGCWGAGWPHWPGGGCCGAGGPHCCGGVPAGLTGWAGRTGWPWPLLLVAGCGCDAPCWPWFHCCS